MFYSQCLLSKKGALGIIWVAAHCLKRLKKDQVFHTNISSSVDKILVDEVPVVTHRVLAFLLLGVVKIYSQKVEYLYNDCNRVVNKINDFAGIKKKAINVIEGMRAPRPSITRPEKMELEAFDLQILEDGNGDNVRAAEDNMLEDACRNEDPGYHSPEKSRYEADVPLLQLCYTEHTPVKEVLSPYTEEKDTENFSINLINSEPSIENLRSNKFSLDDRLDPMVLGESEVEPELFLSVFSKQDIDYSEERNFCETEILESEKHKLRNTKDFQVPMSVDVTFQSKSPYDAGTTPELIGVRTPVIRERGSSSKKRKCLFDDVVVLSNKVVKDGLNDTSSLVCKRRKAPHTALHAWKRHQISNLPCIFSEPFFPCSSLELSSLFSGSKLKSTETVRETENERTPEKLNIPISPICKSADEAFVTPSTPVIQSASLRSPDDFETTGFDRRGRTNTYTRIDEESSQSEEEDQDRCLNKEAIKSQGGVNQEGDGGCSDTTRLIARQLCRSFLSRKTREQNKGISISQTLRKNSRNESARFFYETLVLKTRGYIEIEQNEAYGDILVLETPKLKQAYETRNFD